MPSAIDFIAQFAPISEEEKQFLEQKLDTDHVKAGEQIVRQGEVCRKLIFLIKGATVMMYEREGKVFIKDFIFENSLASVYESFITQEPARYALKAITDCTYQSMSYQDLQNAYTKIPQLNIAARILTENIYLNMSKRFESLITQTAEERYLELLERRSSLLSEVPQYMIASFLGITDVALSRIRNRLANRK